MELEETAPVLRKIKLRMLEPELQREIAELAAAMGYEATITASSNLHFLLRLYQAEKVREKRSRKALKKAEELILRLSSLHHAARKREERQGEEGKGERFRRLEVLEEAGHRTRHENEQAAARIRKLLLESLGFWSDIERHFHDKPMADITGSLVRGDERSGWEFSSLVRGYFRLPSGALDEDVRRFIDLQLISRYLGPSPLEPLPSHLRRAYDLMRSSDSHYQKLSAYLLMRRTAERLDGIDFSLLDNVSLGRLSVSSSCMLLSIATERQNWVDGLKTLLGVPEERAAAVVDDIVRYCRGERHSILQSAKTLGGEGTVVRLDFGNGQVLFFRFGDARSHALGYELLRRHGFPTPESRELHASMCNLEKEVDGIAYGAAHNVSRKTARSLGRLLSACFIFGIPDPNETNFMLRGDEAVKIDAESTPSGWNYYSGTFLGGAAKERPNDSYGFGRLLRLQPGTEREIRAGFVEGMGGLARMFKNPRKIESLCEFVDREYFGAYLYRSAGEGLDEKVLARLRKRLEALGRYNPEELLEKAERGQEVR